MGRPRKPPGTRARDRLHVGVYFPAPMSEVMPRLVVAANADCRRRGLPAKVTLSNLVAHWVAERALLEEQKVLGTATIHEWIAGPPPELSKQKSAYDHIKATVEAVRAEQQVKIKLRQSGRE